MGNEKNYQQYGGVLQEYFSGKKISGRRLNPKISLLKVEQGTWKNFWNEKAIYKMITTEKTDQFSTFSMYADVNRGQLIVKAKNKKLLVDLMTRYKTSNWRGQKGLTLEDSFAISLN